MLPAIIDTDILSEIMKGKDSGLLEKAAQNLTLHGNFTISAMTRYEILRGLKTPKASAQVERFEKLCLNMKVLPITETIISTASDLYADLKNTGQLIGDGDIFIASTAMVHKLVMVKNNVRHYSRVSGLVVENWKQ